MGSVDGLLGLICSSGEGLLKVTTPVGLTLIKPCLSGEPFGGEGDTL